MEFLKVKLLAHRALTRRRRTTDATATAATYSREQNPSSRILSARRSPGLQRRVRALYGAAECSLSWASIKAHRWTERSTSESTVVDVRAAQTLRRRRALWSTYGQPKLTVVGLVAWQLTSWSCWAPHVQRLQVSRSAGAVGMLEHGNVCKRTACFKVVLDENSG